MTRILIVDDEPAIVRSLTIALSANDYDHDVAGTAKQAVAKVSRGTYSAVLLDLGLPDSSGLDVIARVRALDPHLPIIVLSAWQEIETRVAALDLGADDYVPKPFSMPELLARVRVALRHRREDAGTLPAQATVTELGELRIDHDARRVTVRGSEVELTRTQYETLVYFARHPNRVLTHRSIIAAVWPPDVHVDPQNLRVVISQLRKKIERDPADPTLICTDLGVGYRLTIPE